MFSDHIFFGLFLLISLRNIHVFCCNYKCPDKPVFTPSTLVVKHGDSTSATCVASQNEHNKTINDLEVSLGSSKRNGTTLTWSVDRMTEWDTQALCYYTRDNYEQCCTILPVIVYQPPDMFFQIINHTGPMAENSKYTLECTVQDVAPVQTLTVTFYRGDTELARLTSASKSQNTPVTEKFTVNINTSKEDDGAQFYCRADLALGHDGPPVFRASKALNATVYYGPHLEVSASPEPIVITEGDTLDLNCLAVGNPPPSYAWTLPSNILSSDNGSVLTIATVGFEHGGRYTCTVKGNAGNATVDFSVNVRANFTPYIIAGTVIAVALAFCGMLIGYVHFYKQSRMGQYNLKDVFRF